MQIWWMYFNASVVFAYPNVLQDNIMACSIVIYMICAQFLIVPSCVWAFVYHEHLIDGLSMSRDFDMLQGISMACRIGRCV
jgi:hypothetical protein